MKNKKAFTLIELLVVVLIIGILAAIALPQYQKAVLKADIHRGVSLVESLYQAQQAYYLQHGDFAKDIDELDVLIPKNESCVKTQATGVSYYQCDYGRIGFFDNISNAQFQNKPYIENVSRADVAYLHALKDIDNLALKADTRYCFARPYNEITQEVCQNIGGVYSGVSGTNWIYYELK